MDDSVARTGPDEGLPDVTALPLGRLLREGDSVLDNALRRLLADEAEPYAAFGNTPSGETPAAFDSAA
jgi:FXSXX-COOH protein